MLSMPLPPVVLTLARACAARGGRAYVVGGGVRDRALGLPVKDIDVEVFGVEEPDLHALLASLGAIDPVGRSFAVFKLRARGVEIDVALPRRDSKAGPGHRGIVARGDPHLDVKEAARRRDLTVNALLFDPLTHEVLDPWGGLDDLAAKVLRAVDSATFLEDPLRALRVVQLAARLGFAPTDDLVALCRRADLHELPPERVHGEWRKLLLQGRDLRLGLDVCRRADILTRVFPELVDDPTADAALERLAARPDPHVERDYAARLCVWMHRSGASGAEATLDRLGLHTQDRYPTRRRVLEATDALDVTPDTDAALRHLARRAELALLLRARWALTDDDAWRDRLARATAIGVAEHEEERWFRGRDAVELGVQPGPAMGALLERAYLAQLDRTVPDADALRALAATWITGDG